MERASVAPGLCATCHHGRRITSARGSVFWLCRQGALPRYPRLPVVRCPEYRERREDERREDERRG